MKNLLNFLAPKSYLLKSLTLTSLAFFAFSCQTEDLNVPANDSSVALFQFLTANTDGNLNSSSSASKAAPKKGDQSIAAIAASGGFDELVDALKYVDEELNAGLVDLFANGKDQYTVFAPTDDAFHKLFMKLDPDGTAGITSVRDLPADLVLNVLLYHVTDGRRAANSVVPKNGPKTIDTLLGESFSVDSNGMITAGGSSAMITMPDISASNGIIHVIDNVLLP